MTQHDTPATPETTPAPDDAAIAVLVDRHGLTREEARAALQRGGDRDACLDAWKMANPEASARAFRAELVRRDAPWLSGSQARALVERRVEGDALRRLLDFQATVAAGLPAPALAAFFATGRVPEPDATDPPWLADRKRTLQARYERVRAAHPDLDAFTALRVAWGDGRLEWPPDVPASERSARATARRAAESVLCRRAASVAARFDMTIPELGALRREFRHYPRAAELMATFPSLHRKVARELARRGAGDEEIATHVAATDLGRALWTELAGRGPSAFLTHAGVITAGLDPDRDHPYLLHTTDGRRLTKLDLLLAFAEADRGPVLGRLKPVPEVAALGLRPRDGRAPLPPSEVLLDAARDGRRLRLVLRTGHALTALLRRATRHEAELELKGGVRAIVFRHGLYAAEPLPDGPPPPPAPPPEKGGHPPKKGKKGRGR